MESIFQIDFSATNIDYRARSTGNNLKIKNQRFIWYAYILAKYFIK